MLEIWKWGTENDKAFRALLTDLLKTFDCLSHYFLIGKLHAYSLDTDSLNILQDYLSTLKQRTWEQFSGIYISVWHLPYIKKTHFTGYTDDNTPFETRDNITDVIKVLEEIVENPVNWFSNNEMKLNNDNKW